MRFKAATALRTACVDTALGRVRLAATDAGLAGLWFEGQQHSPPPDDVRRWADDPAHPVLAEAAAQVRDYLAGTRARFDLPLDLSHGTAFQQDVWRALVAIPRGGTVSYRALGERIGRPAAVRAVGAAVGRNPISVVVPCHRVIGTDGRLTGYAGGLARKSALLALEGVAGAAR
ncbi:methylated-DNA--[protein]-cysteine S-methyltransferase [Xenophilus sp.]|uniref:methylated-DNA--[protein]-cysteine S-methyltransferase n=2 Tax=Xenophilus sp. TaxID=1873499 RepID=UPI0037DD0A96